MGKRAQNADSYSKKLSKASKKLQFYEANGMDTKAVEESFLQALCDFANSDECDMPDFSEQVEEYRKRVGTLSKIPMTALYQQLDAGKKIVEETIELFNKEKLSERTRWMIDLIYVFGANVYKLEEIRDYEFGHIAYPEHREDKYTGVDLDPMEDKVKYTDVWLKNALRMVDNIYKALKDGDVESQKMYIYDLYGIALESGWIC